VDAAFDGIGDVDMLHLTGITPLLSSSCRAATHRAIEQARRRHAVVSFDVNYRRALATLEQASVDAREIAARADILFVGDDEKHLLTDDENPVAAAIALAERGPSEVVVKRGEHGACAATSDGAVTEISALDVAVVDAVGAGDGFVAGYLAARAHGLDMADRLRWATVCAACTLGTRGDWEGLPSQTEMDTRSRVGLTLR
jgi:2-dehydro-3-deoxygluconokinase